MAYTKIISVSTYDDFREMLPSSGVFDMTDCSIQIWCPQESDTKEVERMVHLVESMVHVTDVQIGSRIEDMAEDKYSVVITEIQNNIRNKYLS